MTLVATIVVPSVSVIATAIVAVWSKLIDASTKREDLLTASKMIRRVQNLTTPRSGHRWFYGSWKGLYRTWSPRPCAGGASPLPSLTRSVGHGFKTRHSGLRSCPEPLAHVLTRSDT